MNRFFYIFLFFMYFTSRLFSVDSLFIKNPSWEEKIKRDYPNITWMNKAGEYISLHYKQHTSDNWILIDTLNDKMHYNNFIIPADLTEIWFRISVYRGTNPSIYIDTAFVDSSEVNQAFASHDSLIIVSDKIIILDTNGNKLYQSNFAPKCDKSAGFANNKVYFLSQGSNNYSTLYVFDLASKSLTSKGLVKWEAKSQISIKNNLIYYTDGDGNIIRLNETNNQRDTLYQSTIKQPFYSLYNSNDTLFAGFMKKIVVVYPNGATNSVNINEPAPWGLDVVNNDIYVAGATGYIEIINRNTLIKWKDAKLNGNQIRSIYHKNNSVMFSDMNGVIYRLDNNLAPLCQINYPPQKITKYLNYNGSEYIFGKNNYMLKGRFCDKVFVEDSVHAIPKDQQLMIKKLYSNMESIQELKDYDFVKVYNMQGDLVYEGNDLPDTFSGTQQPYYILVQKENEIKPVIVIFRE